MDNGKIHFTTLTLTLPEVDKVALILDRIGKESVADWLKKNKTEYYDTHLAGWKPFFNDPKTLVEYVSKSEIYHFQPKAIQIIDPNASNYEILSDSGVRIFFIDPFSIFLKKYRKLAHALDMLLANGTGWCSCFVEPLGFPQFIWDNVRPLYEKTWSASFLENPSRTHLVRVSQDIGRLDFTFQNSVQWMPNPDTHRTYSQSLAKDQPLSPNYTIR